MDIKLTLNENLMIGTAILATFSKTKKSDNIDLMLPFVKFALQENYEIGDIIDTNMLCDYIQKTFAFSDLPTAIVDKAVNRLSKNNGYLTYNNKEYTFSKDVSIDHAKIKEKRNNAFMLIDSILQELTPYLNSKKFKQFTDNDSKKALFAFLDKYGLFTIDHSIYSYTISKSEHINKIIGTFILEEYEKQSEVFNKLTELVKGLFLSKALYLQTNNENLFKERMKNTIIILDAPVLLSILGLKTEGENRAATEFLKLIPATVKLHYFHHNFEELESIIRSYKYKRLYGGNYTHTLEYFDERSSNVEDIEDFYIQLDKKLRNYNITEYSENIPINIETSIDIVGLEEELKEKIPSYKMKQNALENDIKTIEYINRLRNGNSSKSIEKCKAIFITNNNNLVKVTNNFLNTNTNIGHAISQIDFTILMWLKNNKKNTSVPKDILVANAMAATEEVTEHFMNGVLSKIEDYKKDGAFDEENAGLILENIYCRRELADLCHDDFNEFTPDKLQIIQNKYEEHVIQKIGLDNKELKAQLDKEKDARKKTEQETQIFKENLRKKANNKALKISKIAKYIVLSLFSIVFLFLLIFGITSCIIQGLNNSISIWGIIAIIFSVFGIIDALISKSRLVIKLSKYIENKIYNFVYYKKIREYCD